MLNSIFGLILALGILVTIHEYGHFWVARRCGVRVLRFSVGFGKPIWSWMDRHGTEFAVAWIPLGGYVKMLDEREGEVPDDQRHEAFNSKTPAQKIAIALAGPLANVLFAFFAYGVMYTVGVQDLKPIVDAPRTGSLTEGYDIVAGDRVLSVDGETVDSFTELGLALASRVGDTGAVELTLARNGQRVEHSIPIDRWLASSASPNPVQDFGLLPRLPNFPAVISRVESGGAAERAGLQAGDRVVAVDGTSMTGWEQWVSVVRERPDDTLDVTIDREGINQTIRLTPAARTLEDGQVIGYVGAAAQAPQWPDEQRMTTRYWPLQALTRGVADTLDMVALSYQMLGKMVTGQVSLRQVGGPISMAQMAGTSIGSGFEAFVSFLALISISLAIVNLLPVPVLDGGHVVMHGLEWLKGGPLSDRVQMIGAQLGLAFIATLMFLAFVNDIGRLL
ncbi:RIP metalloprotease RseP [Reinekea blandensis]|uniref:Zinc metalloprotease n=1 Tax=Reinekea blandensis MED297 TaxID=314283 RepID=A4BCG3_9GAMM|nr:RIP metalloprotease RseP [Reinekea blandensis]EAR10229.1 predicted membrane-associated Zn-dependent protease 1 [Reinekea sp. MED297] [Reinekea blandensis MED297]